VNVKKNILKMNLNKENTIAFNELDIKTLPDLSELYIETSPDLGEVFISWEVLLLTLGVILVLVLPLILYRGWNRLNEGPSVEQVRQADTRNRHQLVGKLLSMYVARRTISIYSLDWPMQMRLNAEEEASLANAARIANQGNMLEAFNIDNNRLHKLNSSLYVKPTVVLICMAFALAR
jgi:hypothetical protein